MWINAVTAWIGVLGGLLSGVLVGLGFADERFLGGYQSWRRRLVRLGHIAFFGTAALNFALVFTLTHFGVTDNAESLVARTTSMCLVVGAAAMPAVCFLAAWRKALRHLFPLPVLALVCGAAGALWIVLRIA